MQNNRKIKRYVLALVLLVASAYITIFIKDMVDSTNPEKSLPIISVSAGYDMPFVVRAGYTWSFGFKTVRSPYVSAADAPLSVSECDPGTNIVINFSAPYEQLYVYRADGLASDDFNELRYGIKTPSQEGIYVYKIVAQFDKGDILYYFAVEVKNNQPAG